MAKRGGTYVKRGAWAAPASSWAFSPFFHILLLGLTGDQIRPGGGGTDRHKAGAPGGAAKRGGFSLFAGGKGAEAGFPGATAKGSLSPSLFPFFLPPPPPPTRSCTWLVPGRSIPQRPGMCSRRAGGRRAPCRGEGWRGGAEGCAPRASRPLTNTNGGIKGQRRRSRLARGRRAGGERQTGTHGHGHTHTHTPRRAGTRAHTRTTHTHTRTPGQSKGEGAPAPPLRSGSGAARRRGSGGGCAAPVPHPLPMRSLKKKIIIIKKYIYIEGVCVCVCV